LFDHITEDEQSTIAHDEMGCTRLGFSLNFGGEIHLKMYLQIEWRLHTPS
jgi:hypothetical protein